MVTSRNRYILITASLAVSVLLVFVLYTQFKPKDKLKDEFYFTGFENVGNTCYFNSSLQMLLQCKEVCKMITEDNENTNKFIIILKDIINGYYATRNYNLKDFIEAFNQNSSKKFKIGKQHCFVECFEELILMLDKQISENGILDLFNCEFEVNGSKIKNNINYKPFLFYISQEEFMLDNIKNEEIVNGLERCGIEKEDRSNVNGKDSKKVNDTINIVKIPVYLCFNTQNLKMFPKKGKKMNIKEEISFQEEFYQLLSFSVHQGNNTSGHYISYVKYNNDYYKCNDSIITKQTKEKMKIVFEDNRDVVFLVYKHLHE